MLVHCDFVPTEFYRALSEKLQTEVKTKEKNLLLLEELVSRKDTKMNSLEQQLAAQEQHHLVALKVKNQQVGTVHYCFRWVHCAIIFRWV